MRRTAVPASTANTATRAVERLAPRGASRLELSGSRMGTDHRRNASPGASNAEARRLGDGHRTARSRHGPRTAPLLEDVGQPLASKPIDPQAGLDLDPIAARFDRAKRQQDSTLLDVTGVRPSLEAHHNRVALSNDWTGLAALVSVAERWKNLQRLNSTLFALVVLHAVFYGALSRPASRFTLLLVSTVVAVLAGQAVGISLHRRRRHARAVGPTA